MKVLVPERDELSPELAPYFDNLERGFGFVPKIGLVLGYSPNAFEAYLQANPAGVAPGPMNRITRN